MCSGMGRRVRRRTSNNEHPRLERLEALAAASGVSGKCKVLFVDGSGPTSPTTMIGPHGQLVWLKPPAGSKEGETVDERGQDDVAETGSCALRQYERNPESPSGTQWSGSPNRKQ